jgi:hypothetical protein
MSQRQKIKRKQAAFLIILCFLLIHEVLCPGDNNYSLPDSTPSEQKISENGTAF